MSSATKVPETWELTGDDARDTLLNVGRSKLARDGFQRLRKADGFSHARSLAFMLTLVLLEGIIGLVGLASVIGNERFGRIVADIVQDAVPGPAGEVLTETVRQAESAAASGQWVGLVFGLVGAIITGTTLMGQTERALNRLYGIESDRPTRQKYTRALVMALTVGTAASVAFILVAFGDALIQSDDNTAETIWSIVRWPVALALLIAAMALLFKHAPYRHQPEWSWLAYGATFSVVGWGVATFALGLFFRWSSSFGDTYGPLAGTVALLLWALLSSIAVLYGAAVAAQLEAARFASSRLLEEATANPTYAGAVQ